MKKKIAILTQPLGHNYGGILQAYALQFYLKSLGYDVKTVNRRSSKWQRISVKSYIINVARLLLGRINTIPTSRMQMYALENLLMFRDENIDLSPEINTEKEIREYFKSNIFDAVIVGSDQVWRPKYSPSITNFYLDFLDDIGSRAKRIAYAASFGVDDWEYSKELTEKCKILLQKFDAVSVREKSALYLCKNKFGVTAELVADPTLLLDASHYANLIRQSSYEFPNKYALSYVLDPSEDKQLIGKIIGERLGLALLPIKPEQSIFEVKKNERYKCRYRSVESWLQAFSDSSFVVTDSFHGTVFSIIFNKPFVAIGNSSRGMARFRSLLSLFGLEDRLVDKPGDISSGLLKADINWISVNRKRHELSEKSKSFLKECLSDI